jgi:hypothetical protein
MAAEKSYLPPSPFLVSAISSLAQHTLYGYCLLDECFHEPPLPPFPSLKPTSLTSLPQIKD